MRFVEGDPSIRDRIHLERGDEVRFVDAFVDCLDMVGLGFKYSERFSEVYDDTTAGRPPWNPRDLLKALIIGYLDGRRSSRKLAKECEVNDEMKWLLKGLTPSFKALSDFRKDNIECVRRVFKEFVYFCDSLGLFGGKIISVDGSKFKAVNASDRNFSRKKLEDRLKRIEESVKRYLEDLRMNDEKLDKYIDSLTTTMPEEDDAIRTSCTNNNSDKQQKKKKEGEIDSSSSAAAATTTTNHSKNSSWWKNRVREKLQNLLKRKEKYVGYKKILEQTGENELSLTDKESRLMKIGNEHFGVCYNVETTVDLKFHLIPEYDVTNSASDQNELFPMANATKDTLHLNKFSVTADVGFFDALQIKECVDNGILPYIQQSRVSRSMRKSGVPKPDFYVSKFIYNKERDVYICPAGAEMKFRKLAHNQKGRTMRVYETRMCNSGCRFRSVCTANERGRQIARWEHEEIMEEMAQRLKTEKGMLIAEKRQQLSEHPFGTIKRDFGEDYFLLKGKKKVTGEAGFFVLAYNLRRVLNIFGRVETVIAALATWNPSTITTVPTK